jgi:hypothetical protein
VRNIRTLRKKCCKQYQYLLDPMAMAAMAWGSARLSSLSLGSVAGPTYLEGGRKEGRKEEKKGGRAEGRTDGRKEGKKERRKEGKKERRKDGRKEGSKKVRIEGRTGGK